MCPFYKERFLNSNHYAATKERVAGLFSAEKYSEVLAVLSDAAREYPDHLFEIVFSQALASRASGDYDACLTTLEAVVAEGFFCALDWDVMDPIREEPRFKRILKRCQELKAATQASMCFKLFRPNNYSPEKTYPLFIALHGDGHSQAYFETLWPTQEILNQGFVLVYVQSSQVICRNGFGWTPDYGITRRDIRAAFEAIRSDHNIDENRVIVGGFSGGSIAAIEIAMADVIPLKGFISLCPSLKPASFSPENAEAAASRGVRGYLWEGELDGEVPAEQEMMAAFRDACLPYVFEINPGIGHAFPADFPEKLLRAIDFVLEGPRD